MEIAVLSPETDHVVLIRSITPFFRPHIVQIAVYTFPLLWLALLIVSILKFNLS